MTQVEWMDIFSNNLISMLEYARITQRDLADMTGLTEGAISKYINKQAMPKIPAIIALSYALDCDIDDLIDFGDKVDL